MKDTKKRILLSALELFARYGYDATSVSRIAEAVGLTKGALYRHYEDKAAILRAILARMEADDAAFAGQFDLPTEASSARSPLICRQGYSHNADSAFTGQCCPPAERPDMESALTGHHASPTEASSARSPLVCRQGYSHNADSAFTGQCCLPAERPDTESVLTERHASPAEAMGADSVLAGRRNPSVGASEGVAGGSSQADTAALLAFARAMFTYWTKDAFASAFRRMLTVSQYTNPEMQALYRQYLSDGPLTYCEGILRAAGSADARLMALKLFAPMTFLYALYDGEADHTETLRLAEAHFDEMERELH